MKKLLPFFMIAFGATFWGCIAIFVKGLKASGFTEMEIVTIRVTFAAVMLMIIGSIRYRKQFKIDVKKLPLFVGTGIISITFFNWCYFSAMDQLGVSMAVILLYTSPAFVALLSFLFLKEAMHGRKIFAIAGTIAGCILITGNPAQSKDTLTMIGILTGLGSGLGYALYTVFGKFALKYYSPFTVTLYTFIVAAAVLVPFTGIWQKLNILFNAKALLFATGLAFVPTVMAYLMYTWGLERTDGSIAAVIATVEPIVATLLGVFLYNEQMVGVHIAGALLILTSVMIINNPKKIQRSTLKFDSAKYD